MKATGERFIPNAGMDSVLELEHTHRYSAVAHLMKDKNVLDAACGVGYGSALIARFARSVVGIDIDPETIAYAENHYSADNISFKEMSIANLQFESGSFDAVVSFETIEHVGEDIQRDFLSEVKRVLKPEGVFIVSTPDVDVFIQRSHGTYHNPFHIKEYNAAQFEKLLGEFFPNVVLHKQGKVDCSVIDGQGRSLLSGAPYNMTGEYLIAVCSLDSKDIALGSVYQPSSSIINCRFYFDYGEGYSEAHRLDSFFEPTQDGRFCLNQSLTDMEQPKRIRFDPCHFPVKITNLTAEYEDGTPVILTPLNSNKDEGTSHSFMHGNPSYELCPISEKALNLVFSGILDPFMQAEVDGYWATLFSKKDGQIAVLEKDYNLLNESKSFIEQERIRLLQENRNLFAENRQVLIDKVALLSDNQTLKNEQNKLVEAFHCLENDYRKALEDSAEQRRIFVNEKEDIANKYNLLLSEHENLSTAHNILNSSYNSLVEKNSSSYAEKEQLMAEKEQLMMEKEQLVSVQNNLSQELSSVRAENEELKAQYNNILNAQFWKITAPMRWLVDLFKHNPISDSVRKLVYSLRVFGFSVTLKKVKRYLQRKRATHYINSSQGVQVVEHFEDISAFIRACEANNADIHLKKELLKYCNKESVLLISHELDRTGAPVVLEYMAERLLDQGRLPVVVSPHDGALRNTFVEKNIPVIICENIYGNDIIVRCGKLFTLIVVNTIVGAPLISQLSGMNIPVLWWIHEAKVSYHPGILETLPESVGDNIHIYCGGIYAQRVLQTYRPQYASGQLLYYVPDYARSQNESVELGFKYDRNKVLFAIVGALEERKGQDLLVQAIQLLSDGIRDKCLFVFVGQQYYKPAYEAINSAIKDYPESVLYIPQLDRAKLTKLYEEMDCLICPSRDDPMPTVATEAMSLSKLVICSENTGTAGLIEDTGGGILYKNNDPKELANCIEHVVEKRIDVNTICANGRRTYEKYFTQDVFDQNVDFIYRGLTSKEMLSVNETVSVVIPTYNAGDSFPLLLDLLKKQEDVFGIELVIVDSGSSDDTVAIAESYGAKVVHITQSEFSHSYARNLGAQSASGKYVLFMTQDAMPGNTVWIRDMAQPILHDLAVAVSCREEPRKDCDLLGRFSIWQHSKYMGILEQDRLLKMPQSADYDSLRKNSQLNDVACLIRRDVFLQFNYKGDYAEDLDIGLRMIKAGYRLALLANAPVIHSHTRPAFYYLKRCLVDVTTLKKILPDTPMETISDETYVNRMIVMYAMAKAYAAELALWLDETINVKGFISQTDRFFVEKRGTFSKLKLKDLRPYIDADCIYEDTLFADFIKDLYKHAILSSPLDFSYAAAQQYMLVETLPEYIKSSKAPIDRHLKEEICELVIKHCGQMAGIGLASYTMNQENDTSFLNEWAKMLKRGV